MRLPTFVSRLAVLAVSAFAALAVSAEAASPDAREVARLIDRRVNELLAAAGIEPAPLADDATFLRRVHLDLVGRIPTAAETRRFLKDSSPDKRERLVAALIDSGAHAAHLANFLRRAWIPQADAPQFTALAGEFENWAAPRIASKTTYDQLVYQLLTFPANGRPTPTVGTMEGPAAATSAVWFYNASEFKPENLAANTTRAFLGVNLDCAQCHDHPFSRWTRDQFWQTAAFFVRPATPEGSETPALRIQIEGTERFVEAELLTGVPLEWSRPLDADSGRTALARWIVDGSNPFFAKNAVNRFWAQFLGAGLVEPLDDLSGENPASHPELLDELAAAFVASGFDVNFLTQAIVLSDTYQRASTPAGGRAIEEWERFFASAVVRGMTGEQLYASVKTAAGLPVDREDVSGVGAGDAKRQFAALFAVERAAGAQRSITQALALMNGRLTSEVTDPKTSPTLRAAAEAPFLDARGKVETLFLAALGRTPGDDEATPFLAHVEGRGADRDEAAALADVFWVLLNSSEFNSVR